ncbi:Mitochondrial distribution and morphology protein 10 [Coemansia javaensis]|uniref:Mitochondrial distribution and morphology protein 10 n=1 Tax=Coemansia javaensis TaxID=2761396 RepID=A0A9W8HBX3_9FUNG|nr:Mitochondrial distribution and morphology protein 10 [Coemansia javaensis]
MVYTTSDYFPFLIRQFHRETGWDEANSYAAFCRAPRAVLDFAIPHGLSVSTGRSVGSHLNSQLVFSMVPSTASSIGYLTASRPLFALPPAASAAGAVDGTAAGADGAAAGAERALPQTQSDIVSNPAAEALGPAPDRQQQQDLLQSIRAGMWRCSWGPGGPPHTAEHVGQYLMVAQMYPSLASMTGSYTVRRSATSELSISGVSVAGAQPDLQFVVQHATNRPRWSGEATFGTSGQLFGLRGQYNLGDGDGGDRAQGRLSVGGEVYYGAQESSGGMSVGVRYRQDAPLVSELTCVANPLMGHVMLACTRQLRERLCAAAQYDFNAFSLCSELAVGAEWQLDASSLVRVRWSDARGLRCLVDARLRSMVLSAGLELRGGGGGGAAQPGLRRSFGLQLQWFL